MYYDDSRRQKKIIMEINQIKNKISILKKKDSAIFIYLLLFQNVTSHFDRIITGINITLLLQHPK